MSGTISGLFFPSCALAFSLLLCIIYFSKQKLKLNENSLFAIMIISILVDNVCVLLLQSIAITGINEIEIFGYILNKLDFICLVTYAISLIVYVLIITLESVRNKYNIAFKHGSIIFLIIVLIIIISPLHLIQEGEYRSISGLAATITFSVTALCIVLSFLVTIFNFKKINKKHLPVLIMPFTIAIILVLYIVNPYLVIISILLTFMNYIMYFTLENPDLKVIGALSEAKKKAEKYVNEKEIFSFNMSQKIKDPLSDIDEICQELENIDDVNELKEGIRDIKLSSSKIKYIVSDTISGISSRKIDLVENEYNVSNLFALVNQYIKSKSLKYNVEFYKSKYNKDIFAVGDNLKIKQVVCSFALNLIKQIKGSSISLNTSTNNKNDNIIISFKYLIPNINITLEELNKDEELDDYDKLDFDDINLSKLKKLINLLDGYIEIKNVNDNKLEITINFEQKKSIIQNEESLKYLNDYEEQAKEKPHILVVEDNERKEISKYINHTKYDLVLSKNREDCLNKVREGNSFDLIILDDGLDKLDILTVINRLHAIENFEIPVIYAGKLSNEESINDMLEKGFTDVLQKPIKQKEVDEIVSKYIK